MSDQEVPNATGHEIEKARGQHNTDNYARSQGLSEVRTVAGDQLQPQPKRTGCNRRVHSVLQAGAQQDVIAARKLWIQMLSPRTHGDEGSGYVCVRFGGGGAHQDLFKQK